MLDLFTCLLHSLIYFPSSFPPVSRMDISIQPLYKSPNFPLPVSYLLLNPSTQFLISGVGLSNF